MNRILFLLTGLMIVAMLMGKEQVEKIYLLRLPENNRTALGISAISTNQDIMEANALSQAAVVFTRLDSYYGIDKYISISYDIDDQEDYESASVRYSVSTDMNQLKDNFNLLIRNKEQKLGSYYIALFSKIEKKQDALFQVMNEHDPVFNSSVRAEGSHIYTYGSAKMLNMDDALDEALNNALLEYSKYQKINLKTMQKTLTDKTSTVHNLEAVNQVNNLEISAVQLTVFKDDIGTKRYKIDMELRKRINDESDSDYTRSIQLYPFAR